MEGRCSRSSFVFLWWLRFTVLEFCDFLTVVRVTAVANELVTLEIARTYRAAIKKAAEGQAAMSPHLVPSAFGEACRWLWYVVVSSLEPMNADSDVCCPGMHRKGTACVRFLGWRGCHRITRKRALWLSCWSRRSGPLELRHVLHYEPTSTNIMTAYVNLNRGCPGVEPGLAFLKRHGTVRHEFFGNVSDRDEKQMSVLYFEIFCVHGMIIVNSNPVTPSEWELDH
eukprot:s5632_g2.t1